MSNLTISELLKARETHFNVIDNIDKELRELGVRFCNGERTQIFEGIEKVAEELGTELEKGFFSKTFPVEYRAGMYMQIEKE